MFVYSDVFRLPIHNVTVGNILIAVLTSQFGDDQTHMVRFLLNTPLCESGVWDVISEFNSLWFGDAIWLHIYGLRLVQVLACHISGTNRLPEPMLKIVGWTPSNQTGGNLKNAYHLDVFSAKWWLFLLGPNVHIYSVFHLCELYICNILLWFCNETAAYHIYVGEFIHTAMFSSLNTMATILLTFSNQFSGMKCFCFASNDAVHWHINVLSIHT